MEGRTSTDDDLKEEISESFLCCVCLEVLYKPIVLSCGHISCFWCVHKSMNGLLESRCPVCRDPYLHFPSVCQKLHVLLQKMYPTEYTNRGEQILMEERIMGYFSPEFDARIDEPKNGGRSNSEGELYLTLSIKEDSHISSCQESQAGETSTVEEKSLQSKELSGKGERISIADLLCEACEQLLFRPVVLNCGHVYCEACVGNPEGENEKIRCQVCQTPDPRGFPRVCLVLDHFIQERFQREYAARRLAVDIRPNRQSTASSSQHQPKGGLSSLSADDPLWWTQPGPNVHVGVGCDSCGVLPIIGDRYKCADCKEDIGYDLCGECYNSRSKLPGRFNQQHTSDHRLHLVDVPTIRLVSRLVVLNGLTEAFEDGEGDGDGDEDHESVEEGEGAGAGGQVADHDDVQSEEEFDEPQ